MGGQGSGGSRVFNSDGSRPNGLPSRPAGLSDAVASVWDDLISQIAPGILRRVDGIQLETLAKLIVQGNALSEVAMADPANVQLNRAWLANCDLVRKLSACFGLSPSDRKRMAIPAEVEPTEFDELLKRRMVPKQ